MAVQVKFDKRFAKPGEQKTSEVQSEVGDQNWTILAALPPHAPAAQAVAGAETAGAEVAAAAGAVAAKAAWRRRSFLISAFMVSVGRAPLLYQ
jgi:hypothetical protein